ncbi:MAG: hypothetical protein U0Z17_01825 [Bacteroidales bacterium]
MEFRQKDSLLSTQRTDQIAVLPEQSDSERTSVYRLELDVPTFMSSITTRITNLLRIFSEKQIKGVVNKKVNPKAGETYVAEAVEYKIKEPGLKDKILSRFNKSYRLLWGKTSAASPG